ncbi:restriction endonuclease [Tenacibaculum discolor]|uniref:restriction endonuclease n=1 Tax=Tenacibaculum discolor TaxID=361581 RepID=UPI000F5AD72D|nr:restriction endonuclease [Tenacibaculum discolor]
MEIELNQIFSTKKSEKFQSWKTLTKGRHNKPLNRFKGMPYFAQTRGITPLINFHSNPFKEEENQTPWRDLIFQEEGRVIYNGDNYQSSKSASSTFGNKLVLSIISLYASKEIEERLKAPPIIVTRTVNYKGKTGYREFIGFGIISMSPKLIQQYEKFTNKVFSNYQFEVTLLKLGDNEKFNWEWIDARRDKSISVNESLKYAPESWKNWVKNGNTSLSKNRLKIKSYRIVSENEQSFMPLKNKNIINELLNVHYPNPTKDGIRFEAMASFVTKLYFNSEKYFRGWITIGSGDRGVDYVGRLDIGDDDFSKTSIIVLGQSKRYKNSISGEKLTRVASRMTRGYIGVVVTLSTFTTHAQAEIRDDKLPIILINGKKVSELLLTYINLSGKSLTKIVQEQDNWAIENIGTEHYDTILNH